MHFLQSSQLNAPSTKRISYFTHLYLTYNLFISPLTQRTSLTQHTSSPTYLFLNPPLFQRTFSLTYLFLNLPLLQRTFYLIHLLRNARLTYRTSFLTISYLTQSLFRKSKKVKITKFIIFSLSRNVPVFSFDRKHPRNITKAFITFIVERLETNSQIQLKKINRVFLNQIYIAVIIQKSKKKLSISKNGLKNKKYDYLFQSLYSFIRSFAIHIVPSMHLYLTDLHLTDSFT